MKASTIQLIPQPKWTPFEKAEVTRAKELGTDECWINSRYMVYVYRGKQVPQELVEDMIWLSIKRLDKEPIHDWRDLQRIKNELVGEENEAVELYPKESRMVDQANQFHLWVLADEKMTFPFGWVVRRVSGKRAAEKIGGKQRAIDNKN